MQIIQLQNGQQHPVAFCGVGTILGTLVFDLVGETRSAAEIIAEFDAPENTEKIIYSDGINETVYDHYTHLRTYGARTDGCVRISLARGRD